MRHAETEGWWGPFMATHLAELTGEAPYCVGQELVDHPELSCAPGLLDGTHPLAHERGVDAIVLHHRGAAPAMPVWLQDGTISIRVRVEGAELAQLIPRGEGEHAVPAARFLQAQGRIAGEPA